MRWNWNLSSTFASFSAGSAKPFLTVKESLFTNCKKSTSFSASGDSTVNKRSYSRTSTGIFSVAETQCNVPFTLRLEASVPLPDFVSGS